MHGLSDDLRQHTIQAKSEKNNKTKQTEMAVLNMICMTFVKQNNKTTFRDDNAARWYILVFPLISFCPPKNFFAQAIVFRAKFRRLSGSIIDELMKINLSLRFRCCCCCCRLFFFCFCSSKVTRNVIPLGNTLVPQSKNQ